MMNSYIDDQKLNVGRARESVFAQQHPFLDALSNMGCGASSTKAGKWSMVPSSSKWIPFGKLRKKTWKITISHGKTWYKWPFSIAMLDYQRSMYSDPLFAHAIG